MAVTTRKNNPGFLSDEEIIASFCVRTSELTSLVEMLRECTGNSNPHQLVIGPRGSGKTSLLRRVAAEVRREDALSDSFFPIVFAEESYEVATAGEFWLECLSRLAVQAPHREGGPDLHRTYDELRTIRDDQTLENRCLGTLLDFSDREGKRLVLMVENLNMMFGDMADQDAGWRLRKILQTEPRIILLASATSRFDQIDHPDQALYDLFRVLRLRPLDRQECAVLWKTVSGHDARPETIRSLQILTGGDPRLVVIVARFGAGRSFRNLMANLLDLVDDHTEYFKGHIELLPPQERRVYLALADLWKPATTKEITDRARLETSKCSAQLTRLVERGIVEVAGGTARRKQYYLTQRLYNIYYLLRRPRGPDRLVEALIRFMEAFYAPHELGDIGVEMAREAGNFDGEMRRLHQTALVRLLALPALAEHRDSLLTVIPPDLSEVFAQGLMSPDGAQLELAGTGATPHQADHLYGEVKASEETVARELIEKGRTFRRLQRPKDALAICDEVVQRFGASEALALRGMVAVALVSKGEIFWELQRPKDALVICDEIIRRFGASETPVLREAVATALVNKGAALSALQRPEAVLATYDEVMQRFGAGKTPPLREAVATALVNKGEIFWELQRLEDALATYDEVVRRFGASKTPALLKWVATALVNKGAALGALRRPAAVLATYDEVIRRFGTSKAPVLREAVATALVNKGAALTALQRQEDALVICDEVIRRFGASKAPALLKWVAIALVNKGTALGTLQRQEDALTTYDEVIRRFGTSETPALREAVATALLNKGEMFWELQRPEDTLATYDEVIRRFGTSETPVLLKWVATALLNKGTTFGRLHRPEDALATYDEVVQRFGTSQAPALREVVATALLNKGAALGTLQRLEDALVTCDEVVQRFGTSEAPALRETVATALVNKGAALCTLQRPKDALATYDEVLRRLGKSQFPPDPALIEYVLLEKAQCELECHRYESAMRAVGQVLKQCRTENFGNRVRGHLIRARAILASGDPSGGEQDIQALLSLLPELDALPRALLTALMEFSIELGPARMNELIQNSPAVPLLLPLTTALEQELGLTPRVAQEVDEVAQDIRKELEEIRNAKGRRS